MKKYFGDQVEGAMNVTCYSPVVYKYENDLHEHTEKYSAYLEVKKLLVS